MQFESYSAFFMIFSGGMQFESYSAFFMIFSFFQIEIMEFTSEDKEKIEPVHFLDRTLTFQRKRLVA